MAFNLDGIADALRRCGVRVVEVEGWQYRGYAQQDLLGFAGVLWHHTATGRAAFARSNCPTLGLLINGRSDLPGPLCNLALGRDGTVYVVATGVANHAGTGSAPGVPRNMGNFWLCGIECESSGVWPWDWTVEQLAAMPLIGAALELTYMQQMPAWRRLQIAHYEYSDAGKIDIAGYPGGPTALRSRINDLMAQITTGAPARPPAVKPKPKEWDEMATQAQLEASFRKVLKEGAHLEADVVLKGSYNGKHSTPRTRQEWMPHETARTNAKIDAVALGQAKTNANLEALTAIVSERAGLTEEQLKAIIGDAVENSFGTYELEIRRTQAALEIPADENQEKNDASI